MNVSVVLPALYDNESVELLLSQLPEDCEVIVDGTIGLARAVRSGISRASGEVVAVMDCDGAHPPQLLPYMIMLSGHYDLVCASRLSWGTGLRGFASCAGNWFIRHTLRIPVKDCTSGFFACKSSKLHELPESIWKGYGDYYFAMLKYAVRNHWLIVEIPVSYQPRMIGESHTSVIKHSVVYLRRLLGCLKGY